MNDNVRKIAVTCLFSIVLCAYTIDKDKQENNFSTDFDIGRNNGGVATALSTRYPQEKRQHCRYPMRMMCCPVSPV